MQPRSISDSFPAASFATAFYSSLFAAIPDAKPLFGDMVCVCESTQAALSKCWL